METRVIYDNFPVRQFQKAEIKYWNNFKELKFSIFIFLNQNHLK